MIGLLLNRYVIGLIGSLALMAGVYFAWQHFVAAPYRAEGRAEMVPTIERSTNQLKADTEAFKTIEKAFGEFNENSDRLKKLAAQAQKVKIVRQEVEKTRVKYIDRLVPTGATECERTADVITKALR